MERELERRIFEVDLWFCQCKRDVLGIIVDVNLYSEEEKDYLEIVILPK